MVAAAVPATVWAPSAQAIGASWLQWVHDRVRRSFLPPGGSWWEMPAPLTDPAEPAAGPAPAPYWAALVDSPAAHTALTADPTLSTIPPLNAAGVPHPGTREKVDVVFADLTGAGVVPVDGRLGMIAASALRGGGILAVLTRCHPDSDGLVDQTGGIVASAQNADLLYLQHIVIPDQPLHHPFRPTASVAPGPGRELAAAHEVAHADLLVFARPATPAADSQPGVLEAGVATAATPPSAVASGGVCR